MDYEIISLTQLQAMLADGHGARIISLTTVTKPVVKKNCPYKDVRKITRLNGMVNWHYANSVNRQRERESKEKTFEAEPRLWGTRLKGLPFVSHVNKKGEHKLYLEVKVERVFSTQYKDEEGLIISQEKIKEYLKEKKSMKEHQGLDKEVICRDYAVDTIVTIEFNGKGYILRNNND